MAWNGSNQSSKSAIQSISQKNDKSKNLSHGLLAPLLGHRFAARLRLGYGLIFVALGGAAVWWFAGRGRSPNTPQEYTPKSAQITEIASAVVTNTVDASPRRTVTNDVHRRLKADGTIDHRFDVPPGSYRDERGYLRRPSGQRILEEEPKHKIHMGENKQPRIFKHRSENQIAALLTIEPGTIFIDGWLSK